MELFERPPTPRASRARRMGWLERQHWGPRSRRRLDWHFDGGRWRTDDAHQLPVLVGVDEAGRGPLAGPVSVAAVAFAPTVWAGRSSPNWTRVIDDSKRLDEETRQSLFVPVIADAFAAAVVHVHADHIDRVNILQATLHGMCLAVEALLGCLDEENPLWTTRPSLRVHRGKNPQPVFYDPRDPAHQSGADIAIWGRGTTGQGRVLIDGNRGLAGIPSPAGRQTQYPIVKGDGLSLHIAAASVLAKVSRDSVLARCHDEWPHYAFASHKGYPTPVHLRALTTHGPCPIHRQSFAPVANAT